ncbi:MAG: hypothetical protein ABIJ59_01490 [Pseudomonadota bacterium]
MNKIPSRDISGHCEGECRDLVGEGEKKRQNKIRTQKYSTGSGPSVRSANSRNEAPGWLGGHV